MIIKLSGTGTFFRIMAMDALSNNRFWDKLTNLSIN